MPDSTDRQAKLVILDRDGGINQDSDAYIKSPEEWIPVDGSLEAIAKLVGAGYKVAVATNQSGIARQLFDEYTLAKIHQTMCHSVEQAGGILDGIFYCPHGPEDGCSCRKPNTGLLESISKEFRIPLDGVPLIGDSLKDMQAAKRVGCQPFLVKTGKGTKTLLSSNPDELKDVTIVEDLQAAVNLILERL